MIATPVGRFANCPYNSDYYSFGGNLVLLVQRLDIKTFKDRRRKPGD
jgi:hypothetical protein